MLDDRFLFTFQKVVSLFLLCAWMSSCLTTASTKCWILIVAVCVLTRRLLILCIIISFNVVLMHLEVLVCDGLSLVCTFLFPLFSFFSVEPHCVIVLLYLPQYGVRLRLFVHHFKHDSTSSHQIKKQGMFPDWSVSASWKLSCCSVTSW